VILHPHHFLESAKIPFDRWSMIRECARAGRVILRRHAKHVQDFLIVAASV